MTTFDSVVPDHVDRNFRAWQQSMVDLKRSDNPSAKLIARQQEFVAAATSSARLAAYLQNRLDLTPDFLLASPSLQAVAESEMLNTPFEWELHVGQQLADVTPQQARSSPWWYVCHIAWLRSGVFPDPPRRTPSHPPQPRRRYRPAHRPRVLAAPPRSSRNRQRRSRR